MYRYVFYTDMFLYAWGLYWGENRWNVTNAGHTTLNFIGENPQHFES